MKFGNDRNFTKSFTIKNDVSRFALVDHKVPNPYGLGYSIAFTLDPNKYSLEVRETLTQPACGNIASRMIISRVVEVPQGAFNVLRSDNHVGKIGSDDWFILVALEADNQFKVKTVEVDILAGEQGELMFLKANEEEVESMNYLEIRIPAYRKMNERGVRTFNVGEVQRLLYARQLENFESDPVARCNALQETVREFQDVDHQGTFAFSRNTDSISTSETTAWLADQPWSIPLEESGAPPSSKTSLLGTSAFKYAPSTSPAAVTQQLKAVATSVSAEVVSVSLVNDTPPARTKLNVHAHRTGAKIGLELENVGLQERMGLIEGKIKAKVQPQQLPDALVSIDTFQQALELNECLKVAGSGHVGAEFYRLNQEGYDYELADLFFLMAQSRVEKSKRELTRV